MTAVFWKELRDHFGRRRFMLLLGLVGIGVIWGSFVDLDQLARQGRQFFFLDIFTSASGVPISLLSFLSFFGPIIGIALGSTPSTASVRRGRSPGSSRSPCTGIASTTPSFSRRC